jgi:hypothetical protein
MRQMRNDTLEKTVNFAHLLTQVEQELAYGKTRPAKINF